MYNIKLQNGVYSIQEDGLNTEPLANSIQELKHQLEDMIRACEEYEKELRIEIIKIVFSPSPFTF